MLQDGLVTDESSVQYETGTEELRTEEAEQEGEVMEPDQALLENQGVHEDVNLALVQAGSPFACNVCPKVFDKAASLRKHRIKQ